MFQGGRKIYFFMRLQLYFTMGLYFF